MYLKNNQTMNIKIFLLLFVFLFYKISFSDIIFYGTETCPYCLKTKEFLLKNNYSFVEKDISNPIFRQEMLKLYQEFNIPIEKAKIPTILVNNSCLIIGVIEEKNKDALNCKKVEGVLVVKKDENNVNFKVEQGCGINKEQNIQQCTFNNNLADDTTNNTNNKKENVTLSLFTIIIAALADSINPCVLAIMASILLVILRKKDRKKALYAGLIFTFTITFIYFLMGLGIIKALSFISRDVLKILSFILLFIIGLLEIKAYFNYKPGFFSIEMPIFLRKYVKKAIKSVESLKFVFLVAIFLSLTLVPCTSGPYLAILSLLSSLDLALKIKGIIYLMIYNLIFSLPMLMITLLVYFGLNPKFILKKRNEKIREIHLVSGITFLLLSFLILFLF